MKSLQEIEEAIAKLSAKVRRQLVQDIPALCPAEFPADGWDAILNCAEPRPALSSLLDKLERFQKTVAKKAPKARTIPAWGNAPGNRTQRG